MTNVPPPGLRNAISDADLLAMGFDLPDSVDHPSHYTSQVPGIECIDVTEHFSFLRGNAIKYLWRADAKGDPLEDLRKARWYIDREIDKLARRARGDDA